MNDELLAKLRNKALQFETEKAAIQEIYETVWNQIMDEYGYDYLKDKDDAYIDNRTYRSYDIRPMIARLSVIGSNELFSRLSHDGFDNDQSNGRIIFMISREKIEKIINANKENKKGGNSK